MITKIDSVGKFCWKSMVAYTLTLIRHGETKANKENVIQGQSDVPLSDAGIRQAQLLGQRLENQKYSHVFASDLSRAKQTAQTILDKNIRSKGPLVQDSRLRERKFGDVEGKHVSELRKLASCANQVIPHYTPVGGETLQQVRERAILFFQELCQEIKKDVKKSEGTDSEIFRNAGIKRRMQSDTLTDNSSLNLSLSSDNSKQSRVEIEDDEGREIDCVSSSKKVLKSSLLFLPNGSDQYNLTGFQTSSKSSKSSNSSNGSNGSNGSNASLLFCSTTAGDGKQNEDETTDDIVANVLVVSHGGLLKELIRHFVEDLGCILPPGSRLQAFKISPNTGLSKFTVTVYDDDRMPSVTCHVIHDDNHLLENGSTKEKHGNLM